jgi:hypothetical protein
MNLLWAAHHYTGGMNFQDIQRVHARWEKVSRFTECGLWWDGGWLMEITHWHRGNVKGTRFVHMHAFKHSAEPWEDDSKVWIEFLDNGEWPEGYDWEPYLLERTHRREVTPEGSVWHEL